MDPIKNIPVMHHGHLIGKADVDESGLITAELTGSQILGRKLGEAISDGIITHISFSVGMSMTPVTPMSEMKVRFHDSEPITGPGIQIGHGNIQHNRFR